ncbi:hypothetical protein STEG23_013471, partial [Scotinomys teguina]
NTYMVPEDREYISHQPSYLEDLVQCLSASSITGTYQRDIPLQQTGPSQQTIANQNATQSKKYATTALTVRMITEFAMLGSMSHLPSPWVLQYTQVNASMPTSLLLPLYHPGQHDPLPRKLQSSLDTYKVTALLLAHVIFIKQSE